MTSTSKVAIVTGAGSGIGRHTALALLRAGYSVVLAGRQRDTLQEVTASEKELSSRTLVVPTDVTEPSSVSALFAEATRHFDRIDLLFTMREPALRRCRSRSSPSTMEGSGGCEPYGRVPMYAASLHENAIAAANGWPHHQQWLHFGARPTSAFGALYRYKTCNNRPYEIDLVGWAKIQYRLRPDRYRQCRHSNDIKMQEGPPGEWAAGGRTHHRHCGSSSSSRLHGKPASGCECAVHDRDGDQDALNWAGEV